MKASSIVSFITPVIHSMGFAPPMPVFCDASRYVGLGPGEEQRPLSLTGFLWH